MDEPALEKAESGKGMCLSELRGVQQMSIPSQDCKDYGRTREPAYNITFSREAASEARVECLRELGWQCRQWVPCILCGDRGRGNTPNP